MKTLIIAFVLIVLSSFVLAFDINDTAREIQNSQVQITITKYYDIKIQGTIIPELNETIGRSYSIGINHTQNGIFVSGSGVLISGADSDEEEYIKEAVDKLEAKIIADMSSIEHIKKYGSNATAEQNEDYLRYFRTNFGSIYSRYRNTSLNITKGAEARSVKLPNQNETFARLVKKDNQSQIVQVSTVVVPSIKIVPNATYQRGDQVYIVGVDSEELLKTALISDDSKGEITLDKAIENGQVALDKNGNVVGIGKSSQARQLLKADVLLSKLQSANITNSKSSFTQKYEDAVVSLRKGEYQSALEQFEDLEKQYPSYQIATYRAEAKEKADEFSQMIKNPFYWVGLVVLLCIIYFGVKYLNKPKESGRKRGRYQTDDEVDYSK